MELEFRRALYLIGTIILLIALLAAVFIALSAPTPADIFEAFSYGITFLLFSFFSGILAGVGISLIIVGLLLRLKKSSFHIKLTLFFALLSFLIGLSAVADSSSSTFLMFGVFFAGLSSCGVFLLSAVLLGLTKYLLPLFLKE
ncbi:MAG: hypothetical protein QXT25_02490 [Candidatus Anstonellaceae archaeon]